MELQLIKFGLGFRFIISMAGFAAVALVQASDATPLRENFCEGWQFHLGDVAGAEQSKLDDSAWRPLDIPHDWSIELPLDPKVKLTNPTKAEANVRLFVESSKQASLPLGENVLKGGEIVSLKPGEIREITFSKER